MKGIKLTVENRGAFSNFSKFVFALHIKLFKM